VKIVDPVEDAMSTAAEDVVVRREGMVGMAVAVATEVAIVVMTKRRDVVVVATAAAMAAATVAAMMRVKRDVVDGKAAAIK
jgi:hypothetical protein